MSEAPDLEESLRKERADLRIIRHGKAGGAIEVRKVPFIIGRVECDLNLEDGSISRKHCELLHREERWLVHDLGSSNGTFVNGEKVTERQLDTGDTLKVGQTEIRFTIRPRGASGGGKNGEGKGDNLGNVIDNTALWNIVELSVGAGEAKTWTKSYLESVMKQFGADRGVVVLHDAVTGSTMPSAVVAMDWEGTGEDIDKAPLSRSIVEEAINGCKIVMTTNAEVDPRFKEATSVAQYDIAGVLCAPARWQGKPVGALYVERSAAKKAFSEAESQQLQDLADLYGTAQMAWRGHSTENKKEWEREGMGRIFRDETVDALIKKGGASAIRRRAREIAVLSMYVGKADAMVASGNEECWRMMSQLYAQVYDIMQRWGGGIVAPGCAVFGGVDEGGADPESQAVHAGVEIQKIALPLVKRIGREMKIGISICVAIAGGEALVGYFGGGRRIDFLGLGDVFPTAQGMAFQGENAEVLIDQQINTKVRLTFKTHRMAPVMLPGGKGLTQLYRVVPY